MSCLGALCITLWAASASIRLARFCPYRCAETIAKHLEKVDLSDIPKTFMAFKEMLDENKCVQDVIWKFHMTIESGLLNIDKIKAIFDKLFKKALRELLQREWPFVVAVDTDVPGGHFSHAGGIGSRLLGQIVPYETKKRFNTTPA